MEIEIIDKNLKNENFYKRYKREILISELLKEDSDLNIDKTFYLSDSILTDPRTIICTSSKKVDHVSAIVRSIDFYKKTIKIFILNTYSGKIAKELIKDGFNLKVDLNERILFYD